MVAGGYRGTEVEIIDLETSSTVCTGIESFPELFGAVGVLGPNQRPLICGGSQNGVTENKCFILENGHWQLFSLMNEKRTLVAIAPLPYLSDGFSAAVTGGTNGNKSLNTFETLNQNLWHQSLIQMPQGVQQHCMVQINRTTIIVIGGGFNNTFHNETYLFNSDNEQWTPGPTLQVARRGLSCARIKTKKDQPYYNIIAVGGYNGARLSTVEILDDVTGNWRYGPALPVPRYYGALVEDPAGGVILIGGETSRYVWHDTLFRLSHAGPDAMWFQMPQKLKNARTYLTSFLIPDEITNCTQV